MENKLRYVMVYPAPGWKVSDNSLMPWSHRQILAKWSLFCSEDSVWLPCGRFRNKHFDWNIDINAFVLDVFWWSYSLTTLGRCYFFQRSFLPTPSCSILLLMSYCAESWINKSPSHPSQQFLLLETPGSQRIENLAGDTMVAFVVLP